jgi:AcrR family transcriptional regulator
VREAVLRATLEELAEAGYAALSFEGIARRAGVHKTTLYRRWESLEDLLLDAFIERGFEQVPIPDTGSLRRDLLAYGREIAAGVEAPEVGAMLAAVASGRDRDSALAEASRRFWDTRFELAGEMVGRAVERGEIPGRVDPRLVVQAMVAPIYFRLLMTGEPLDDSFLKRQAALIAAGAGAPD